MGVKKLVGFGKNVKEHWSVVRRSRWFHFFLLWLAPFLVLMSFFFASIFHSDNEIELFLKQLRLPTLMHAFTALIFAVIVFLVKRPKGIGAKLVVVTLLGLLMVNYDSRLMSIAGFVRSIFPILPEDGNDIPVISLLFLVALVLGALWVGRTVEKWQNRQAHPINIAAAVFVVIGVVFVGQAVRIMQWAPQVARQSNAVAEAFPAPKNQPASDKPDIYYIVLDRYASADVLQKQFQFDNRPFTGFLRGQQFVVNDQAHSNYPYTAMSIASTMNAGFTKSSVMPFVKDQLQSRTLFHHLIRQSNVVKALKQEGYTYHNIGSWYGATNKAPLSDVDHMWDDRVTAFGKTKRLRGLESVQVVSSPFYRFGKVGISWWPLKFEDQDFVGQVRSQLTILDELSQAPQQGGRLITAHILVPHEPFLFNADGSLATDINTDSVGRPIRQKYTDQVQAINTQMEEIITSIRTHSKGQAVILINADEGPYPQTMADTFKKPTTSPEALETLVLRGDMRAWSDEWLQMKFGILQAAHIPRASKDDMAHLSSTNLFRIVLNRYAGYDLPYLPECQFALPDGSRHEFKYTDITKRFSSSPDPACAELGTVKSN